MSERPATGDEIVKEIALRTTQSPLPMRQAIEVSLTLMLLWHEGKVEFFVADNGDIISQLTEAGTHEAFVLQSVPKTEH